MKPERAEHDWLTWSVALVLVCLVACGRPVEVELDVRRRACTVTTGVSPSSSTPAVTWISPRHPDERRDLDLWCATVGAPVVESRASPATLSTRLIVVSWNIHVGGGDLERLVGDLRAGRLTEGEQDLPFVLLLQEAFRAGERIPALDGTGAPVPSRIAPLSLTFARTDTTQLAARLGVNVFYVPSMRNGPDDDPSSREDRGAAILSTLPFEELRAIELPLERQRRVAIAARLRVATSDGAPADLLAVSVHLENRTGIARAFMASPTARKRQARALAAALADANAVVMGGDLNTWTGSAEPALSILRSALGSPIADDRRPTFVGGRRIDFILARLPAGWALSYRRLDDRYGSDHYPLVAILQTE